MTMTPEQIAEAFHRALGHAPREADVQMAQLLGASPEAVAEFIWDHHMGEPDAPSLARVTEIVKSAIHS